jgi:hypothetical protein
LSSNYFRQAHAIFRRLGQFGKPLGKGDGTFESAISLANSASFRARVLPNGHASFEYHHSAILAERDSVISSQISKTRDRLAQRLDTLAAKSDAFCFGLLFSILTPGLERAAERSEGTGEWAWPLLPQGT